jgi:hypothetical protein
MGGDNSPLKWNMNHTADFLVYGRHDPEKISFKNFKRGGFSM